VNAPDNAWPLAWPVSWPRSRSRTRAKFGVVREVQSAYNPGNTYKQRGSMSIGTARDRLLAELQRLGATAVVLSTNIRVRGDGLPYSKAAEPDDPGVAVYFRLKGEPRVLACDKWDRVADNLAALAKHIEAVRGQVRWGVGSLEQAFGGYRALPAMGEVKQWWEVLGVEPDATIEVVEARRDKLLMKHHPDRGGSHSMAAEINAAFDLARRELGAP
jgi:hypothetical protein